MRALCGPCVPKNIPTNWRGRCSNRRGWNAKCGDRRNSLDEIGGRMASDNKVQKLRRLKEESKLAGGTEAVGRQHERGKMTARERLAALLDEGSFQEIDALVTHHVHDFGLQERVTPGDGVVTGYGTIEGRLVDVSAQDFTVMGGLVG